MMQSIMDIFVLKGDLSMTNEIKKRIKQAFYNYPSVMKDAVVSTVEWAESNFAVDYSKVSVQTSPSNYKETQLCALIDDNLSAIRWCYVVEKVLDHYHFETDKVKFVQMHYFKKKSEVEICLDIGIGRRTFYRWQDEIIEEGYKWAKELKLIGE